MLDRIYPRYFRQGYFDRNGLLTPETDAPDNYDSHDCPLGESILPKDEAIDSPSFIIRAVKAAKNIIS